MFNRVILFAALLPWLSLGCWNAPQSQSNYSVPFHPDSIKHIGLFRFNRANAMVGWNASTESIMVYSSYWWSDSLNASFDFMKCDPAIDRLTFIHDWPPVPHSSHYRKLVQKISDETIFNDHDTMTYKWPRTSFGHYRAVCDTANGRLLRIEPLKVMDGQKAFVILVDHRIGCDRHFVNRYENGIAYKDPSGKCNYSSLGKAHPYYGSWIKVIDAPKYNRQWIFLLSMNTDGGQPYVRTNVYRWQYGPRINRAEGQSTAELGEIAEPLFLQLSDSVHLAMKPGYEIEQRFSSLFRFLFDKVVELSNIQLKSGAHSGYGELKEYRFLEGRASKSLEIGRWYLERDTLFGTNGIAWLRESSKFAFCKGFPCTECQFRSDGNGCRCVDVDEGAGFCNHSIFR